MAGNSIFTGQDGNIYVDFDVQNLIVVDPNRLQDKNGKIIERTVDHENLVMYANLETKLLPRTKLAVGATVQDQISTISIAEINFLKPGNQKYLNNDYTNEITGLGVFNKGTTNKTSASQVESTKQKPQSNLQAGDGKQSTLSTGLLGITSINVKIDTSFVPQVTIELEDVQGRALFEKGDLSPYAAFFHLPYPPFYLTLKGFYGQAVRHQLNLISFTARFNSYSGNYQVTLQFYGYKYNILNEIPIQAALSVSHMYASTYTVSKQLSSTTKSQPITQLQEGGMAKIQEVYRDYKEKKLIPLDFPELALDELLNRLEMFEKNVQNNFNKADVLPLTESVNFRQALVDYERDVFSNTKSWFKTYCDETRAIVVKKAGFVGYPLKKEVKDGSTATGASTSQGADAALVAIINKYNERLNGNPVFGKDGGGSNQDLKIDSPVITFDNCVVQTDLNGIDFEGTWKIRNKTTRKPNPKELEDFTAKVTTELIPNFVQLQDPDKNPTITFYTFEGQTKFSGLITKLLQTLNSKSQQEEEKITAAIAAKFENKKTGIGFRPSIKNIITVIMASTEAYIRLLDDVHKKAWDVREDPDRRNAILRYPSSDMKENVKKTNGDDTDPIYPWPQFFMQDDKETERFVIKYPGDPAVVDLTQGFNYRKWPEIQFVEEFIKAITEKGPQVQDTTEKENEEEVINRLTLNGIEFPQTNEPYFTREKVKFLFEIWERTYLNSHYNRFQRGGSTKEIYQTIGRNESDNIVQALGISAPFLIQKLKNYAFTFTNYLGVLSHVSNNGTGPSIQKLIRDYFATAYIQTEVDNSFEIYDQSTIDSTSPSNNRNLPPEDQKNFNDLIQANVSDDFCDTYPFTDQKWLEANVETSPKAMGGLFYKTQKTLFVNSEKKVITNFTPETSKTSIRPVTSFSYMNRNQPVVPQNNFNDFYRLRDKPSDFISTEGYIEGFSGPNAQIQTSSIMNTPFFVNALQNGVKDWVAKKEYPFVQASYLFLNSLPLSTLRGTYKTKGQVESLDYIAASIKRFGGVHKLPYAWILKLGSVYHRYKKFIVEGVDILDTCWKNFDYLNNFDPKTGNIDKIYDLSFEQGVPTKVYLQGYYFNPSPPPPALQLSFTSQTIQSGFYPRLINDMSIFFNGVPCFETYSDTEIQLYIDSTLKVGNIVESNVDVPFTSGGNPSYFFKMKPLTVTMKNTSTGSYYTIPSFGSLYNQVPSSIFDQNSTQGRNIAVKNILSNNSIYNGTVRMFWGLPNYGYFDVDRNTKPSPSEYMTYVFSNGEVSPMSLGFKYSNIEEIFAVFDKSQLEMMELKFLNFSKSVYDTNETVGPGQPKITLNLDTTDPDRYLKNFQLMMREFCEIDAPSIGQNTEIYLSKAVSKQFDNITNIISNFLEYNIVMKFGNPSLYNRKLFDSFNPNYETGYTFVESQPFTLFGNTGQFTADFKLVDPFVFKPYVQGSLPTNGGTTTLQTSLTSHRDAWRELRLQLGPTTISGLLPTNNGSYITDFFVDNNIEFTAENVKICAPLIRIFATQKLKKKSLDGDSFKNLVFAYSESMIEYQKNVFDNLFVELRKNLPTISDPIENTIKSSIQGEFVKTQVYENLKAVNDKWIAGNAYNEETLLQDFLFVDRASRNVGNSILIDVFSLKTRLKNHGVDASVYTIIAGTLIENHFTVMPLPSYVNFYNIQTPDGSDTPPRIESSVDFANNLWGTFLSVDYRNSQPKLVCFYTEKPSNYPDLGRNKDFRYKNDGFACNSLTENPLLTNQTDKTDWALSNRCVGFVVDIGLRNQNVFNSFSIDQTVGLATTESLAAINQLANQASGSDVVSSNVSLLNIYNERSYSCTVVGFGNALIQPTMYFCLNHVPMFNGAYMITSVNHTITPGFFETTFKGTRQRVFSSERPNNYLISLNKNLVQKLVQTSLNNTTETTSDGKTDQTSKKTNDATNSCQNTVANGKIEKYKKGYTAVNANASKISVQEFANKLKSKVPAKMDTEKLKTQYGAAVFAFSFVSSSNADGTNFESFGNNYGNIDLLYDWTTSDLFLKEFCCVKIGTDKGSDSKPFARFENVEKYIQLMGAKFEEIIKNQALSTKSGTSFLPTADALFNLYISVWSKIQNIKEDNFKKNQGPAIREKIEKSLPIMETVLGKAGFQLVAPTSATNNPQTGQPVNPNVTTNADDRSIFSTASPSSYTLNVSTISGGNLKIDGNIGSNPLSKVYNIKIFIVSTSGSGGETLIGETTLTPNANGQKNGFSFTTNKDYTSICTLLADKRNQSLGFTVQIREYPEYKYSKIYRVMNYDCLPVNLLRGFIASEQKYNEINANPCAICYPNGGRNIKINGKDCLPNTAPPPKENIYDISVFKDGLTAKPLTVTFRIKPNVGNWKIFTGSSDIRCEGTEGETTDGTVASDGQSIVFDIPYLLDGCGLGSYSLTLKALAQPILPSGQQDTTRTQNEGSYILQGQVS